LQAAAATTFTEAHKFARLILHMVKRPIKYVITGETHRSATLQTWPELHQMFRIQLTWMRITWHLIGIHTESVCRATVNATRAEGTAPRLISPSIGFILFGTSDRIADTDVGTHAASNAFFWVHRYCAAK
jgi:hypothetical protein